VFGLWIEEPAAQVRQTVIWIAADGFAEPIGQKSQKIVAIFKNLRKMK
jgi:hypothetical protein